MYPAAEMTGQRAGAPMDDVLWWRKRTLVLSVRTMTCQWVFLRAQPEVAVVNGTYIEVGSREYDVVVRAWEFC
jgi:hypothetical protein